MSRERFVAPNVSEVLSREQGRDRAAGGKRYGPIVRVDFPAADAPRAVVHGLGIVPDGFEHARCTGPVFEVDWLEWTAEVAILQSSALHTTAVGRFFTWSAPTAEDGV